MISFLLIEPQTESEALISFMTSNSWPFHVNPAPSRADILEAIEEGAYLSSMNESYWIDHEEFGRIGFLRLEDLEDDTPLLDLRLAERFRGKGLAKEILARVTAWVFEKLPHIVRFEGQTRDDNIAMRKTFTSVGWVKEAYYRHGWPVPGWEPRASVAYAVLRSDLESGVITPVPWDEE